MSYTRRQFLGLTGAGAVSALLAPQCVAAQETAQEASAKLRLSACDWSFGVRGNPEGLAQAKAVGLDGLEISSLAPGEDGKVSLADPEQREAYKAAREATGVAISSVAMGFLNGSPFATEGGAVDWVAQTIDATKDLDTEVILLAFFGKGDLRSKKELKQSEVDATVAKLKELAPKAEEAGVILGLENTLSAEQNLAIVDRVKSDAVQIYYDIGNSTNNGYDVPAEIRLMGDRMCQVHFKDRGYLGEGKVEMAPVAEALNEVGYKGWIVLETSIPSKDRDADFKRNADYVRELMGMA